MKMIKRKLKNIFLKLRYSVKIGSSTILANCRFGKKNSFGKNSDIQDVKLGNNVYIGDNSLVWHTELGDFSYLAYNVQINNAKISKFCSVGPGVKMGLGMHPADSFISTHPVFYSTKKQCGVTFADKDYFQEQKQIFIGNDVWIGANVVIMDGVKIEDGAIIAAGAIVNKDVPAYAIVGGIPAKIIKYRFNNKQISILKKSKWWDKDERWLRENYRKFLPDGKFFDKIKNK